MWLVVLAVVAIVLVALGVYIKLTSKDYNNDPVPDVPVVDMSVLNERWLAAVKPTYQGKRYLVVGGGFLGARLARALLARGEKSVKVFDIVQSPLLPSEGITFLKGDVRKPDDLDAAMKDVDVVFSTFAVIRFMERLPHQLKFSYDINVGGTQNVIKACQRHNVQCLIQTSTSNVNVDFSTNTTYTEYTEETPYVTKDKAVNHYSSTKAEAEQLLLQANKSATSNGGVLHTAALRPCSGIFGYKDTFGLQFVIEKAPLVLLGPEQILDWVYVDNVVYGHLLLEKNMASPQVQGLAFGISNESPLRSIDFFLMTKPFKRDLKFVTFPRILFFILAHIIETTQRVLQDRCPSLGEAAMMTPPGYRLTQFHYVFKGDRAKKMLGYRPVFTLAEAIQRTFAEDKDGKVSY